MLTACCVASVGCGDDPAPDDRPAVCVVQPKGTGGLPQTLAQWAEGAQLFGGLGYFHRPITTKSEDAQAYFDQGMRLLWAFNHDEATRSFAQAAVADPQCAMCYWGVSLTVGPNYNLSKFDEPRAVVARDALRKAQQHSAAAKPVEQELIRALARRYPDSEGLDRSAYADEMRAVAQRFPDDTDVQVMTAEALMNIKPWKLWKDDKPEPATEDIVAILEKALAKDPHHPGANHYYIHAVEASPHPGKGLAAAERLPGMMPAAGHLEHMPSHIMQRVGRYEAAAEANRYGIAADLAYYAITKPLDYYIKYTAHNYQFLAFSAAMEGRKAETIQAARQSRALVSDEMLLMMPGTDWYVGELYAAMVRFGMWDAILAEPAPKPELIGLSGAYLYAKAAAFAAKGRIDEANAVLKELRTVKGRGRIKNALAVAVLNVEARIALTENKNDEAINKLYTATAQEDGLAYSEPSDWFFPNRHILGAVLLKNGLNAEAEAVYRQDLTRHPNNGWALYGLAQSLRMQGRYADAETVQRTFDAAWKNADVTLVASAF
jgi:tetratricopeptide (TPR) repeat protein